MAIKIAIGGTPHAGKTVLMGILRSLLPRELFVVVEAAPDGEGITGWSAEAAQEVTQAVRQKGRFLPEFVSNVVASIRNSTMPITLVDLGGMQLTQDGEFAPVGVCLTQQNEAFVRECSHIIVIAPPKYAAAVPVWLAEAERLGVKPLAVLESVLSGADDELFDEGNPIRARITKLDRTSPPVSSATAQRLVERMLQMVAGEQQVSDGSDRADVNFPRLAEELDLPFKAGGNDRDWLPAKTLEILAAVAERCSNRTVVRLWGNTPSGFPYHAIACGIEGSVAYFDPKVEGGYIELSELVPQGAGNELLEWGVSETDDYTVVRFAIPRQVFDHGNLPLVVPPVVSTGKGVVLSGKAPRWLTGSLARAYHHAGATWVACLEPQESGRKLADGCTWNEANPGLVPAVVVAGENLGQVIPIPIELVSARRPS